ncbi:Serine/threonine-protein kinase PrkC [Luteitalea pratensis]|uniref:non-specific serine/threonine protein kinase n=1 Tax=Luteitalea pratensis TaxID=1855912 RepID=A0A143PIH4_LUTPR|nr:serine/threonine-protein kinase [Luteitalea pratensis]AMY08357.1 Serine/threonine-protein kinase PrkC [Luteitalea pratensis]
MSHHELPLRRRTPTGSVLAQGAVLSGRYHILDYIGEGGMGQVYRAHDRALDEVVAIKVLLPHLLGSPLMSQRFLSEIKLARKVTHRNVCRIHDYGEDGTLGYISMQFVEGIELTALIAQSGGLAVDEAYAIAIQLADGLQAIHDEGIVHRDFKAANVMIDRRGNARLMDFGIAKLWNAERGLTTEGQIAGTPAYMSPEQAAGEPIDPRTDLYSMGIVLFELFTGSRPFTAENAVAVMYKHAHEEPPLDGPIAVAIPARVKPIIRKLLAKQRSDRFSSSQELKQALLDVRAALPAFGPDTTERIVLKVQQLRGALDETVGAPTPPSPVGPAQAVTHRRSGINRRGLWQLLTAAGLVTGAFSATILLMWRAPEGERTGSLPAPAPVRAPQQPTTTVATSSEAPPPTANREARQPAAIAAPDTNDSSASPGVARATPAAESPALTACGRGEPRGCGDACEAGNSAACTQLGVLYNRGAGVARDLTAAALYYDRGCSGGDLAGCNNLGTIYQHGASGLQGDRSKAASLYERACNGGHLDGCANLGLLYLNEPDSSVQQRTRGRELLRQACAAGLARACRAAS